MTGLFITIELYNYSEALALWEPSFFNLRGFREKRVPLSFVGGMGVYETWEDPMEGRLGACNYAVL